MLSACVQSGPNGAALEARLPSNHFADVGPTQHEQQCWHPLSILRPCSRLLHLLPCRLARRVGAMAILANTMLLTVCLRYKVHVWHLLSHRMCFVS